MNVRIVFVLFTYLVVCGCNKEFKIPNSFNNYEEVSQLAFRKKVLMIEVDGVVGKELAKIKTPNIELLRSSGLYSNRSVSGYLNVDENSNYRNWASQLIGKLPENTNVFGNNFDGIDFKKYPTIFKRIKSENSNLKTVALTSTNELGEKLCKDADKLKTYSGDEEQLTNDLLTELGTDNNGDFIYCQYNFVDKAGGASGYLVSNNSYNDAILKVDKYVGMIYEKIRTRESFEKENWLVILCSNKGSNSDLGLSVPKSRWTPNISDRFSTFFVFSNLTKKFQFAPAEVVPKLTSVSFGSSITIDLLKGPATASDTNYLEVATLGKLLDIDETKEQTIHFKFGFDRYLIPSQNVLLSKRPSLMPGTPGWYIYFTRTNIYINVGQRDMPDLIINLARYENFSSSSGKIIPNSFFIMFRNINGRRYVNCYMNGILTTRDSTNNGYDITDYLDIDNSANLKIGITQFPETEYSAYSNAVTYGLFDLKFYNTALDASYISENYCNSVVYPIDKYYNKLLCHWPLYTFDQSYVSGKSNILSDFSKYENDIKIIDQKFQGHRAAIDRDSIFYTNFCATLSEKDIKNLTSNSDYYCQIINWFGIHIPSNWELDGKAQGFSFFQ